MKHPGYPVVLESLDEDVFNASLLPIADAAKQIFAGFPKDFDYLTSLQKEFIYENSGTLTLFYLRKIPAVYKSIHKDKNAEINKNILEGKTEQIFVPREIEAIECAKEAALKQFGTLDNATVIIVLGRGHDLKPYCKKAGFEYELVNTVDPIYPHISSDNHFSLFDSAIKSIEKKPDAGDSFLEAPRNNLIFDETRARKNHRRI